MSNSEYTSYHERPSYTHEVTFYLKVFKTYRVNGNSQESAVEEGYERLQKDPMHHILDDLRESAEVEEIKKL